MKASNEPSTKNSRFISRKNAPGLNLPSSMFLLDGTLAYYVLLQKSYSNHI